MKLFTKYSRKSVAWLIGIFLAGSAGYYVAMRYVLIRQIDEVLRTEHEETETHVRLYGTLPKIPSTSDQQIKAESTTGPRPVQFRTVVDRTAVKPVWFRQIDYSVWCKGRWYQYTVSIPLEHTETLLKSIVLVTVVMTGILLLAVYSINQWLNRRLMTPFYTTLDRIGAYQPATQHPLVLPETDVDEFSALNESITAMSERVGLDFQRMKSFTAHAAHEMQTPVAVVRGHLDNLLQTATLSKSEAIHVESMERALGNLSRMQRSLLLLTRVETGQFAKDGQVAIHTLVQAVLDEYRERLQEKGINVRTTIAPVMLYANESLCQSLVSNLIRNAVRYNMSGGHFEISLDQKRLAVSNTSYLPALDRETLYQPFFRHPDTKSSGTGLGLPIIKQICESNGWYLEYGHLANRHQFSVWFSGHPE